MTDLTSTDAHETHVAELVENLVTLTADVNAKVEVIEQLNVRITELDRSVDNLQSELERAAERHRSDINRISRRLTEEAERRNWCNEYDDILNEINEDLHVELTPRSQRYRLSMTVEVDVSCKPSEVHDRIEHVRGFLNSVRIDEQLQAYTGISGEFSEAQCAEWDEA